MLSNEGKIPMMLKKIQVLSTIILITLCSILCAEEWTFLDTERIGAKSFINKYPNFDGKDVVIIILDTGVDMGVLGLDQLPSGDVKVIDAQDFSGEGDVFFEKAEIGTENNEKFLKNPDDIKLYGYNKINHHPTDSIYFMGVLN